MVASPSILRRNPLRSTQEDEHEIIRFVDAAYRESESARRTRMDKSGTNLDTYLGRQDWSNKVSGQSTEFIPKSAEVVEQFSSFINRGLTNFGDWFEVEFAHGIRSPLREWEIRELNKCYMGRIPQGHKTTRIETVFADGAKVGMMESLMGFKVHGRMMDRRRFISNRNDPTQLQTETIRSWVPIVEPIRTDDYFPDPSGRFLYEIHETEDDWHVVESLARDGILDRQKVEELDRDFDLEQQNRQRRQARDRNQDRADNTGMRRRVVRREFWGTILDPDGKILHENVVCEIDNRKILVRPPEPNPFWHQESPFAVGPLIRVPFSVWHKALMDDASPLNLAMNEVFNLMLDGGLASVWGIRQLRLNMLQDPTQAAEGIAQGETLIVKDELQAGAKVMEQVTEGDVPQDAAFMFEALSREFTAASLSSELKLGALPSRRVLATEINEISASQAVTLDSVLANIERGPLSETLRKFHLNLLQHADDLASDDVIAAVGQRAALILARLTPAQRFALFGNGCNFKVNGLTATLGRAQQFQKIMVMLTLVSSNPLMLNAFLQRYSADKVLTLIIKLLTINPKDIEKDIEELLGVGTELRNTALLGQSVGGGAPSVGGANTPETAQINQSSNPLTGISGGEG